MVVVRVFCTVTVRSNSLAAQSSPHTSEGGGELELDWSWHAVFHSDVEGACGGAAGGLAENEPSHSAWA